MSDADIVLYDGNNVEVGRIESMKKMWEREVIRQHIAIAKAEQKRSIVQQRWDARKEKRAIQQSIGETNNNNRSKSL